MMCPFFAKEMTTLRKSIEDIINGGGPPFTGKNKAEVGTNRTGTLGAEGVQASLVGLETVVANAFV